FPRPAVRLLWWLGPTARVSCQRASVLQGQADPGSHRRLSSRRQRGLALPAAVGRGAGGRHLPLEHLRFQRRRPGRRVSRGHLAGGRRRQVRPPPDRTQPEVTRRATAAACLRRSPDLEAACDGPEGYERTLPVPPGLAAVYPVRKAHSEEGWFTP